MNQLGGRSNSKRSECDVTVATSTASRFPMIGRSQNHIRKLGGEKMKTRIKNTLGLIVLTVAVATPMMAQAIEFKRLVVFGASLSDPGNAFALTGQAITAPYKELDVLYVPPSPYSRGGNHFSNGATWIEALAQQLHLDMSAGAAFGNSSEIATNYAVGGARAREDGINVNLSTQVATFLSDVGYVAPVDTLYVIDMGANDVRDAIAAADPGLINAIFGDALTTIGTQINQLYFAGARHFLVLNVPDFGVLPSTRILDYFFPGTVNFASQLTAVFNANLAGVYDSLGALPGIRIARLDIHGKVNQVIATPEAFGIVDVVTPCLTPNMAPYVCEDPSRQLFWDGIHPTKAGHDILAREAAQILIQ